MIGNLKSPRVNNISYLMDEGPFYTLKDAVNEVRTDSSDMIFIPYGTYSAGVDSDEIGVSIDRYTTVVGANKGKSVIQFRNSGTCIALPTSAYGGTFRHITLRNFCIEDLGPYDGVTRSAIAGHAISATWGWGYVFNNIHFKHIWGGVINMNGDPNNCLYGSITNCFFDECATNSDYIYGHCIRQYANRVWDLSRNYFYHSNKQAGTACSRMQSGWNIDFASNEIETCYLGASAVGGADYGIRGNTFWSTSYAIELSNNCSSVLVEYNMGDYNTYAFLGNNSKYNTVRYNIFINNAAYGFTLQNSHAGSRYYGNYCSGYSGQNIPWQGTPTEMPLYIESIIGGTDSSLEQPNTRLTFGPLGNIETIRKSNGAPSDANYGSVSGNIVLDTSSNTLYIRDASTWKGVAL